MNRTVVIAAIAVVVAGVAAFVVGRSTGSSERDATPSASTKGGGHERATLAEPVIAGAEHVHALAYASDERLLLGTHAGLYASEDDGTTWARVETTGAAAAIDFMSVVPHPTEPRVLYASGHGLGVVKSTDGGSSWARTDRGIDGTDIHALAINQRQPQYLFAYSVGHGVYRSTDGGASWDRLDDGPANPGVRSFAYMAVQTDMDRSMGSDNWGLLFAGTADGIYDSYSCFCGWRETTDHFDGTTVYTLATLHDDLRTMYAGTSDGLWRSADEGKTWKGLEGPVGRVTAVAINPEDPAEVTAVSELGVVFRTADGGRTWVRRN